MADEEELYLANLDEFVNDENRIVSFLHSTFFKCTCLIIFLKYFFDIVLCFLLVLFKVTYKWLSRTLSVSANRAKQ